MKKILFVYTYILSSIFILLTFAVLYNSISTAEVHNPRINLPNVSRSETLLMPMSKEILDNLKIQRTAFIYANNTNRLNTQSNLEQVIEVATSSTFTTTQVKPSIYNAIECNGNWLEIPGVTPKIDLGYSTVDAWSYESTPSILSETQKNENIVLLGHNYCNGIDCYTPSTNFGTIINAKIGNVANACIDGEFYSGTLTVSKPMPDTSLEILTNWRNTESITAFTCYGQCYEPGCAEVKERWVISFNR